MRDSRDSRHLLTEENPFHNDPFFPSRFCSYNWVHTNGVMQTALFLEGFLKVSLQEVLLRRDLEKAQKALRNTLLQCTTPPACTLYKNFLSEEKLEEAATVNFERKKENTPHRRCGQGHGQCRPKARGRFVCLSQCPKSWNVEHLALREDLSRNFPVILLEFPRELPKRPQKSEKHRARELRNLTQELSHESTHKNAHGSVHEDVHVNA